MCTYVASRNDDVPVPLSARSAGPQTLRNPQCVYIYIYIYI